MINSPPPSGSRLRSLCLSILLASATASAAEIKPFSSDGCSIFPDGTYGQQELWLQCCIRHDLTYWKGGSRAARRQADEDLRLCVAEAGEPQIAELMLAGVRAGGSPYWPTKFRWGYGWPYLRFYRELSQSELEAVKHAEQQLPADWLQLIANTDE